MEEKETDLWEKQDPQGPSKMTPKAVDKIAQEIGKDVIQKFQEEEDKQGPPIPVKKVQKGF